MGDYKDTHGKSRLKAFIEKAKKVGAILPDEVYQVAQMFVPAISVIREAINKVRDSKQIDQSLKLELIEILELMETEMLEITERHRIDTGSESWLSRNVRPMMLITITMWLIFIDFTSGIFSHVDWEAVRSGGRWFVHFDDPTKERWWTIEMIVVGFYFGGKTAERLVDKLKGVKLK